jgi:uncharacterized membrane protein YdjX (TVP38/TMEM64 family)
VPDEGRFRGVGERINEWVEQAVLQTGLAGADILLVTIPLAILQGFLGLFPFALLITLHVSALGIVSGLLASWIAGTTAAIVVYGVCKYLFADWFHRKWWHKLQRYEKWQRAFDHYGIWAIIFLRTVPVMPNNLISFMSAVSPIRISSYIWSSILGNMSHIWLIGIFSSAILFPDIEQWKLIVSYAAFCLILLSVFLWRKFRRGQPGSREKSRTASI